MKNILKLFSCYFAPILFPSARSQRQKKGGQKLHTHAHIHTHIFLEKKTEYMQSCSMHISMRNRSLGSMHISKKENQVGND